MRDLLNKLDNLQERAVSNLDNKKKFVAVKNSDIQSDIKKHLGQVDNIYVDADPSRRTVNLVLWRPDAGKMSRKTTVGISTTPNLFKKIIDFLKKSPSNNYQTVKQLKSKNKIQPSDSSQGTQSDQDQTAQAKPDGSTVGPSLKTDRVQDGPYTGGFGGGKYSSGDPQPSFIGSIGQGSAGTEIGGEDPDYTGQYNQGTPVVKTKEKPPSPSSDAARQAGSGINLNYGKPENPPPQSNPNPPINLQPSLIGPDPGPISPGSFSGLDQQPGSQQSSAPDSNDTDTVTNIGIGDPTDDSPSGEIPLLSPNRPGTGDVADPVDSNPLADQEAVDQARQELILTSGLGLDQYEGMYDPVTKQYDDLLVDKMMKNTGRLQDYESLRAIYGVESSYGTNIEVGDSDRTGSYGGMQISRDNVQRYVDGLKFDVELDVALNHHPFLMVTSIMYFTEQVEKVESSLKKNTSYNADKKQNKSHIISWGFPVIDKSHFTSRNKSTGKREPVEYRVEVLKKLYPDWGDFFDQNKDKWKNKYDTKEKFAYKTKVEKTIVVPPEIDAKYVYAAITYNGGPDEVSREGKLKSNPFTYNYADKFLSLLKTQKGISEHKELIRLKTLITTDKYRNTTKEIVVENSMRTMLKHIDNILNQPISEGWKDDLKDIVFRVGRKGTTVKDLLKAENEVKDIPSLFVSDASMIGNFYGMLAVYHNFPLFFHADGSGRASLAKMNPEFKDNYQVVSNGALEKRSKEAAQRQAKLGVLPDNIQKKFKIATLTPQQKQAAATAQSPHSEPKISKPSKLTPQQKQAAATAQSPHSEPPASKTKPTTGSVPKSGPLKVSKPAIRGNQDAIRRGLGKDVKKAQQKQRQNPTTSKTRSDVRLDPISGKITKPVASAPASEPKRDPEQTKLSKLSGPRTRLRNSVDLTTKQSNMLAEASMNVSMNGSSAAEVAELLAMIKNAGMPEPKSMAVMAPAGMSPGPIKPSGSCGCGGMEEDTVEEDHANEPDEMTMDTAYMTKDLAGGMNRPKPKGALRAKDPAIHYDDNIKENLKDSLQTLYKKLNEKDPYAELDNAIASDDMEDQLKRQEKLARAKMKKKNRSNADAAHGELGAQMDQLKDSNETDPSAAMKQITGTPGGGKQHSQYDKHKNKPAMDIGTAQAPISIKKAQQKSRKYPELTVAQADEFDKIFHNFQNNPVFQKNIRRFDNDPQFKDDLEKLSRTKYEYIKNVKDKLLKKFKTKYSKKL